MTAESLILENKDALPNDVETVGAIYAIEEVLIELLDRQRIEVIESFEQPAGPLRNLGECFVRFDR